MKQGYEKYIPFVPLKRDRRSWPDKELKKAPVWCSVDLRDGNQALIDPMNVTEKLELFHTLVDIGVKEIEVGFPSASEVEYEFLRTLEKDCRGRRSAYLRDGPARHRRWHGPSL